MSVMSSEVMASAGVLNDAGSKGQLRMLLLDEPSLGLAPIIVSEIFKAIRKINENGTTVLFVEQNSKIALNTANRGYVLQTGEIVLEGLCKDLLVNEEVRKAYLGEGD